MSAQLIAVHPAEAVCARCPEIGVALDALLPDFVDQTWGERVEAIDTWLSRLLDLADDGSIEQRLASCIRARTVVTAMLESVPGVQIDSIDAAMLVHLSVNTPWRLAACRWFQDVEVQRIDGWLTQHPGICGVFAATTAIRQ